MTMTRRMKMMAASAAAVLSMAVAVPVLAGKHDGDRHRERDRPRHERNDHDDAQARPEMRIVDGQVRRMLVNPYGEADGLLLSNGTVVQVPSHMADRLTAAVRPGDRVTVQGLMRPAGQDIRLQSLRTARGSTLAVEPESFLQVPRWMRASPQTPISATGTIAHVVAGRHGEPRTLIFGDGTTAKLNKAALRTSPGLQPGMTVALTGHGTATRYGRGIAVETIARR